MILNLSRLILWLGIIPRNIFVRVAVDGEGVVRSRALPWTHGRQGGRVQDGAVDDGGKREVDVAFDYLVAVGLRDHGAVYAGRGGHFWVLVGGSKRCLKAFENWYCCLVEDLLDT